MMDEEHDLSVMETEEDVREIRRKIWEIDVEMKRSLGWTLDLS